MAYSRVPFTYTGGPQVFPTNFALGVLEVDHITVTVNGVVDGLGNPVEYAFTYNNATGNVTVTDTLTIGQSGFITRAVPVDALIADFEAGADVSKRNLVRAVKQTLMAVQEAADGREEDSILINETVDTVNTLIDSIADDVAAVNAAAIQTAADAANADADAASALAAKNAAEAAAASTNLPSLVGGALRLLRVNAAATGYELRTAAQVRADLSINGIGSEIVSDTTNLDTITRGDTYHYPASATGNPLPGSSGTLLHLPTTSLPFARQIAWPTGTPNRMFIRQEVSGVWTGWTEIQAALGFTPVEQGGGAGMGTDKIRIGWDGSAIRVDVGGTDLRRIVRNDQLPAGSNGTLNAPGNPPLFACRAWAVFNGSNGVIRNQGNVSSVVKNSLGNYTINFTSAMVDAEYLVFGMVQNQHNGGFQNATVAQDASSGRVAGAINVLVREAATLIDAPVVFVGVIR